MQRREDERRRVGALRSEAARFRHVAECRQYVADLPAIAIEVTPMADPEIVMSASPDGNCALPVSTSAAGATVE